MASTVTESFRHVRSGNLGLPFISCIIQLRESIEGPIDSSRIYSAMQQLYVLITWFAYMHYSFSAPTLCILDYVAAVNTQPSPR